MLLETNFNEWFKPIATHYRHEMSAPILKIYYEHLSKNLTETELMEALKKVVIKFPVQKGLPSPEQIVNIIVAPREEMALKEWQMIVKACSNNDRNQLAYLSNRGHIALLTIGGFDAVAYEEGSLHWLQKDFTQFYCQCSDEDQKVLRPAPVEKPPRRPSPFDPIDDPVPPEKWAELKAQLRSACAWKKK
jgi:hypothetical protein